MIAGPYNSGAAVGANGAATATGESPSRPNGLLYAVQVRYNDAPPAATTDILIKTKGNSAPSITILSIANAATDGLFFPRMDECKAADGAALASNTALIPIQDIVQVTIAGADAGDNIDVWLYLI